VTPKRFKSGNVLMPTGMVATCNAKDFLFHEDYAEWCAWRDSLDPVVAEQQSPSPGIPGPDPLALEAENRQLREDLARAWRRVDSIRQSRDGHLLELNNIENELGVSAGGALEAVRALKDENAANLQCVRDVSKRLEQFAGWGAIYGGIGKVCDALEIPRPKDGQMANVLGTILATVTNRLAELAISRGRLDDALAAGEFNAELRIELVDRIALIGDALGVTTDHGRPAYVENPLVSANCVVAAARGVSAERRTLYTTAATLAKLGDALGIDVREDGTSTAGTAERLLERAKYLHR